MDCSPAGSSLHGVHQMKILQLVTTPFSKGRLPLQVTKMAANFVRKVIQMSLALWAGREGGPIMYQSSELMDCIFTLEATVLAAWRRGSDDLSRCMLWSSQWRRPASVTAVNWSTSGCLGAHWSSSGSSIVQLWVLSNIYKLSLVPWRYWLRWQEAPGEVLERSNCREAGVLTHHPLPWDSEMTRVHPLRSVPLLLAVKTSF